jgi:undecaprenyl-diphosphatase
VIVYAVFILKNHGTMLNFYLWVAVQIVLESLPVSSSGHICLLEKLLDQSALGTSTVFDQTVYKKISYSLHAPTALVLMIFFNRQWLFLLKNLFSCYPHVLHIVSAVVVADVITVMLYCLWQMVPIACSSMLGFGFAISIGLLASLYWMPKERARRSLYYTAVVVGLAQGCALLPGISRFAATYVMGCWTGLSWRRSFEFSFAIQFPLIAVASLYGIATLPLHARELLFSLPVLATVLGASAPAYLLLSYAFKKAQRGQFYHFAWYVFIPLLLSVFFM